MSDLQVRGVQPGGTGTASPFTAGLTGAQRVQDAHGHWFDAAFYKRLFMTASGAYTIVAGSAIGQAFGTLIVPVAIWNPVGSGVLAVIQKSITGTTSGTPGGPLRYFFAAANTRVSSVATGIIRSTYLSDQNGGKSMMMPLNGVIIATIPADTSTVSLDLGVIGGPAAVAVGAGNYGLIDSVDGAFIVPPGCVFGIGSTATGTSQVVHAALYWEEVPLLP